jgi:hypothetical protein
MMRYGYGCTHPRSQHPFDGRVFGLFFGKVTLSFPDWKDGQVAPATYEVSVVDPEPKAENREAAESGE